MSSSFVLEPAMAMFRWMKFWPIQAEPTREPGDVPMNGNLGKVFYFTFLFYWTLGRLVGRSIGWSVGKSVSRSVSRSVRWLVGWLVGSLTDWLN